MKKKMLEVPELKIVRFECKDVIATSGEGTVGPTDPTTPIVPPHGTDFGGLGPEYAKGRAGIPGGKVSWD